MIELENTVYDEKKDGLVPIVAGTYPAHVQGFDGRDIETKNGTQKVFNVTFQVADEAKNVKVNKITSGPNGEAHVVNDENGMPVMIEATYMVGKRFNSTGIWLTPQPAEGQGWRNRRYKDFFTSLGVVFPQDKEGRIMLAEVEEEDVAGQPCLVKIDKEEYEKDGETRTAWKVFNVYPWKDGQKLSAEEVGEDLPF